jgi:hypothetical protein
MRGRQVPRHRSRARSGPNPRRRFSGPCSAKVLWHVPRVPSRLIDTVAQLEPSFRLPGLATALIHKAELDGFLYAVKVIRRLMPKVTDRELAASLQSVTEPAQLPLWFERWLNRAPLPNPPWRGTKDLRPLRSGKDLRRAALRLKNCLHDQVIAAAAGKRVFYLWRGPPPAIVALEPDPFLGWVIAKMHRAKELWRECRHASGDRAGVRESANRYRTEPELVDRAPPRAGVAARFSNPS